MGLLVTTAQNNYNDWINNNLPKTTEDWAKLSDTEVIKLYRTENQLKLEISNATNLEADFYESRQNAIKDFEIKKQDELSALLALWQSKEDNGFNKTYIP